MDNSPHLVVQPQYGPDAYSRGIAVSNASMANPFVRAVLGVGVRRPDAGNLEGHSDALYNPVQNFASWRGAIVRPTNPLLPHGSSFPNTSVPTDTSLVLLNLDARAGVS